MSRRSRVTTSERIDRDQRRRVGNTRMWNESPVPLDVRRLSGAEGGGGGGVDPGTVDCTWTSWGSTWLDDSCEWA